MGTSLTCDCSASLITDADGHHCPACGWSWRAPYFLRVVLDRWRRLEAEAEAKRAEKAAKKAGIAVAPVADAPQQGGVFVCMACKSAPRRYSDFPNTWKWKTEKGFREHRCLGVKEGV